MSFVQAIFLFGAAAVLGPIIAHLLARPRYRRIPFTMLRFLQVGKKDTQSKRRIRNLLLLLLRSAIIVVLAMLFAGPRLVTQAPPDTPMHVYYIGMDNSISMSYQDGSRTYWDKALAEAGDIIGGAAEDSTFNICTLASGGWTRDLNAQGALACLARFKLVPGTANVEEFLSEVKGARRGDARDKQMHGAIVSDFTPQMLAQLAAVSEPALVEDARHVNVSAAGGVNNLAIVGAAVTRSSRTALTFSVTAANYGSEAAESRVCASIGDKVAATTKVALSGSDRKSVNLEVPVEGSDVEDACVAIEFSLERPDGLGADDRYYAAVMLPKRGETNIVVCGSDSREVFLLKTAFEALSEAASYERIQIREIFYNAFEPAALKTANVAVFAGIPHLFSQISDPAGAFVRAGGRAVFFVSKESNPAAMEQLFTEGVLPALPRQLRKQETAVEARGPASDTIPGTGNDDIATLQDYAPDRILLTGSYECEAAADSAISWFLNDSNGFLFVRRLGNGVSMLVNTSADDSLGTLMKSPAAVAFCRLLLGTSAKPVSNNFICGEPATFPAVTAEEKSAARGAPVWVVKPSGQSAEAAVVKSTLIATCPDEAGFLSTLAKPVRYAGINLPEGETDVTPPTEQNLAMLSAKAFRVETRATETAGTADVRKDYTGVWRYFAWSALALVLLEAYVANRSQR